MDYDLAKRLKDAGFPQDPEGRWLVSTDENVVILPTLSELIDALGDKFYSLTYEREWIAKGYYSKGYSVEITKSTAEAAVAKLWLALNVPK